MKKYCLALDLKNDERLIAEYEEWHRRIWPEVKRSIIDAGIEQMEIYRAGNRLMMIIETNDDFSFAAKQAADDQNPKVQEWEQLMWQYQQALPWAKPGEKWMLMDKIFEITNKRDHV